MEFQPRSYSQSTVYVTIAAHLECATWPHRKRSLELEFRELENSRESFNGQTKIKKKIKEEYVQTSVGLSAFASGSETSPGQYPHVM